MDRWPGHGAKVVVVTSGDRAEEAAASVGREPRREPEEESRRRWRNGVSVAH